MSSFSVKTHLIEVLPHPNADKLDLARIGAYLCVIPKDVYATGDLVAYIPEQAIVPVDLQKELGVEGKLAGSDKNRVKAVKLRGVLSQGLVLKARDGWTLGQDVTEELGITKWEPPIPTNFAGEVTNIGQRYTTDYDIENFKNFPHIFVDGEEVVFTEKIHGTCTQIVLLPAGREIEGERLWAGSKGLGARGLMMRKTEHNLRSNAYVRAMVELGIGQKLLDLFGNLDIPVILLGETYGKGVQDLHYGETSIAFRAFDIILGDRGNQTFLCHDALDAALEKMGIERVPVLYRGPFSREAMDAHVSGKTVAGKGAHIREGIVIRPTNERQHPDLNPCGNRVQLKYVSGEYLTRKGGTEFN